jgi:hypothetical protein
MHLDSLLSRYHATDPDFFDQSLSCNPDETIWKRVKREFYSILEDGDDMSELCDGIYSSDEIKFIASVIRDDPS